MFVYKFIVYAFLYHSSDNDETLVVIERTHGKVTQKTMEIPTGTGKDGFCGDNGHFVDESIRS